MNLSFQDVANACPFSINDAAQCFAQQTTYLRCQRLPWIVYVAIAGLILLIIMDAVLLIKLRKERARIKELGSQPQH